MFSVILFSATVLLANRAEALAVPRMQLDVQQPLVPLSLSQTPIVTPSSPLSPAKSSFSTPISSSDDRSTFHIIPAPDYTAYLTSTDLEHKAMLRVQLLEEMALDWLYTKINGELVAEITYKDAESTGPTAGTIKLGTPFTAPDSPASKVEGKKTMWFDTARPGMNMGVVGIELDGKMEGQMEDTRLTARLDLTSPYTVIPAEAYERLLQATHATMISNGVGSEPENVVDCSKMHMYPQIVVRFDGDKELLLEPVDYIMDVKTATGWRGMNERCVLAVKGMKSGSEEGSIAIGWAGLRGRKVVLDWGKGRTGIEV